MNKVRFGCDIDGVIYRWDDTARYLLNSHWGINYLEGVSLNWNHIHDQLKAHGDEKAWLWLWSDGVAKHGLFRYGSIYKGAREFLMRVATKAEIVVITSRPPLATLDTMAWLAYQQFPTSEVHIVRERNGQKKSDILPHCDVYLDDGPHNIKDLLEVTKAVTIMMDRPWNQEFQPPPLHSAYFVRARGWDDIEREIDNAHAALNEDK